MDKNKMISDLLIKNDPWGLIANGAPLDEYESYIDKIKKISDLDDKIKIKNELELIFCVSGMPTHKLDVAIKEMAQEIMKFKQI